MKERNDRPQQRPACDVGTRAERGFLIARGLTLGGQKSMNWKAIVRHYKTKHYPRHAEEIAWFAEQKSLADAIHNATFALDRNAGRYGHQRWLSSECSRQSEQRLCAIAARLASAASFHELFLAVSDALQSVNGAGDLYIYDVAFRIGSYRRLTPEKVYLHSGTRVGAEALKLGRGYRWLDTIDIPKELQHLSAAECEDILCIYKDEFAHN